MNIQVNGACVNTSVRTLKEFLYSTAYKDKSVAVEYNGELVSRDAYETIVLTAADRLEIVTFVGGG